MGQILTTREAETPEAKARWFRSLSVEERMRIFCEYSRLVRALNPKLDKKSMLDKLKPVFASFEKHEVKYLVFGGIAAILHGVPRLTFDLDVLIEPSLENAERLLAALSAAGSSKAALTTPDQVLSHEITVFDDLERIDVETWVPGLEFAAAWARRDTVRFEYVPLQVVCKQDLIASKRAAGRPVDLEDVRSLEAGE